MVTDFFHFWDFNSTTTAVSWICQSDIELFLLDWNLLLWWTRICHVVRPDGPGTRAPDSWGPGQQGQRLAAPRSVICNYYIPHIKYFTSRSVSERYRPGLMIWWPGEDLTLVPGRNVLDAPKNHIIHSLMPWYVRFRSSRLLSKINIPVSTTLISTHFIMSWRDDWPKMPDGSDFNGKDLLTLVRNGNSPFRGVWDVNLLIREIEETVDAQVIDIPAIYKGSNNYVSPSLLFL